MKSLFLVFFYILTYSISNAQITDLTGSWEIVEFAINSDENSVIKTEEQLKKDGSVWNLFFMNEDKFKQTSNMSETGTMDSQEGTWKILNNNLTLELLMNGQKFKLNYTYMVEENMLVLTRSNPMGTMKIISKFKKDLK